MALAAFLLATVLSFFLAVPIRRVMRFFGIVDRAKAETRKIHRKNIPLGGGLVIFFALFLTLALLPREGFVGDVVSVRSLAGVFVAGAILMIGGLIDDTYRLRPRTQILFPVLASVAVIGFGIGPNEITNPFGGVWSLEQWSLHVDGLGQWVVLADLIVFFWLMGVMYTTKLLDGLDGLVTGIAAIGALVIFFLARQPQWLQPDVAVLAIAFVGACIGFLPWNWHPAKMFLGEGGSLFAGFMLAVLAVISGGKIATTLLVLAIPMLDIGRVLIRRYQKGKPLFAGDREHLHYQLLARGVGHKQTVFLFYAIALLFGMTTLFLQSAQKLIALLLLLVLMLVVGVWFSKDDYVSQK